MAFTDFLDCFNPVGVMGRAEWSPSQLHLGQGRVESSVHTSMTEYQIIFLISFWDISISLCDPQGERSDQTISDNKQQLKTGHWLLYPFLLINSLSFHSCHGLTTGCSGGGPVRDDGSAEARPPPLGLECFIQNSWQRSTIPINIVSNNIYHWKWLKWVFKECEGSVGAHQVHELHQAALMSSPTWTMALEHGYTLQVVSGLKVWHKHHGQETIRSRNVGSELNSSRHFRVLAYRITHFSWWNVQRPCVKLQK